MQGGSQSEGDVYIRQVPGGCLCCSAISVVDARQLATTGIERLLAWLKSLSIARIKAVVITTGGIVSVNGVSGALHLGSVDEVSCSRLELLDDCALPEASMHEALLQCLHP